ncbi:MAG: proline--tRNA ligase [Actinobacteria bacterium]|nr:proline--tRNA ligase [Actinomycetota bacterium]
MRFSILFAPTLKESPAEAEIISHKLLLRAGMIRKVAAGIYSFLPLGYRTLKKIENIIREEMDRIGAQEMLMPALQPADPWKKSGRWDQYGLEMMRLKDRNGREFALGPTHEELITDLAMKEVRSYRQLPLTLYQIQVKFRDEIRPRFGLMRAREFIMKDAYSFNANMGDLTASYNDMYMAYNRIFSRCGLEFRAVEAASGLIGGKVSQEFMVLAEAGEDTILYCGTCDYAASQDVATSRMEEPSTEEIKKVKVVDTPRQKSVDEVSAFLGVPADKIIKTLIYKYDNQLIAVIMRGDRDVNEEKLATVLGTTNFHLLTGAEWQDYPGLVQGYVGPVGLDGIRLIADNEVSLIRNFVVGANLEDAHMINVNVGEDFQVEEWADLKMVRSGDACPRCQGTLISAKGIEVGHIFQLGTKYSEVMGATFIDEDGLPKPYIMGCYGIGVSRLVAAAIEQNYDEGGIIWPVSIAPYEVEVVVLNYDRDEQREIADRVYTELGKMGIEAVLDDRIESAGKKFADADLIGIPVQVVIGTRTLKSGNIEVKIRSSNERKEFPLDRAVDMIVELVKRMRADVGVGGNSVEQAG